MQENCSRKSWIGCGIETGGIFFATNLSKVLQKHKMMVKDHMWVLKKYFTIRAINVAMWQDHLCSSSRTVRVCITKKIVSWIVKN